MEKVVFDFHLQKSWKHQFLCLKNFEKMFVANSNCAICSICSFSCCFVTLRFIFRLYHFQFFCSNIEMTWNCLDFRSFLVSSLLVSLFVNFSKFLHVSRFNECKFFDLFRIVLCYFDAVFSSNAFEIGNFLIV